MKHAKFSNYPKLKKNYNCKGKRDWNEQLSRISVWPFHSCSFYDEIYCNTVAGQWLNTYYSFCLGSEFKKGKNASFHKCFKWLNSHYFLWSHDCKIPKGVLYDFFFCWKQKICRRLSLHGHKDAEEFVLQKKKSAKDLEWQRWVNDDSKLSL